MLWLPKLLGKRCVATIHGLDHQRGKWGKLASAYIMLGEKCAVRFADEIIVLSRNVQKYFLERYGRETKYIPNGVNRPERREVREIKEKYGLQKQEYILFLGRIVPEKGVHLLIEAFRKLRTDKKLVIAGSASDSKEYYDSVRRAAEGDERILFTGFVQGRVLEELYSNAWLYVLPSELEGMPLSLLEAMSYGCCCLVSDIPECREVVGERAMLFRRGDAGEIEERLTELLADEEKAGAYRVGAMDVCREYSWDRTAKETLELYGGVEGHK